MSTLMVGVIALVMLFVLVLMGWEIGLSLICMSVLGIWLSVGNINVAINILGTSAFSAVRDYMFSIIPLFVLMGLFANQADMSRDIYDAANVLLRRMRGGLAIATIAANAVFAAITGVSVASAAIFTKIAIPEMGRLGYDKKFAAGTVAGSSVLGMLIPPSLLMIVYGSLSDVSVGKLFIAGVLPGILLSTIFIIGVIIMSYIWPEMMPTTKESQIINSDKTLMQIIFKPWAAVLLIILVLGGIWFGFFTPTEAGGIGALGAFILALSKRKITLKSLWGTLLDAGISTGSIFFVLIAAQMYSRMLAMCGVVNALAEFITSIAAPNYIVIMIFMVILMLLGCILDSTSILLLCMPLMVPVISSMGLDLIWFGIVAILAIETGLLTPPFGISVFTVKSSLPDDLNAELQVQDLFQGVMPYLIMMIIALVILIAVPAIVTYLPNNLM